MPAGATLRVAVTTLACCPRHSVRRPRGGMRVAVSSTMLLSLALGLLPASACDRLVLGRIRVDDARLRELRVKEATSEAEVHGAARLLHDAYVARGIMPPHASRMKMHPQALL